jgi:hypothetical protein
MKAFPAIQIAGGLLGPELLEEVWKGEAEGQKPEDFRPEILPAPAGRDV